MKTPIYDFVKRYANSDISRLHMPGHKGLGVLGCEKLDITEIKGADSLYEACCIIAESEKNAAALFGTKYTFYSAGGSSQALKAMLHLALQQGKERKILAARNVHKAFIHAAALLDFEVQWLWAKEYNLLQCAVTADMLENELKNSNPLPAAVYITSPDYLGHIQPIAELAKVCHRYGVLLLVDNAHGAYLHFLETPSHPMDLGADLCCDSAHKTLPVLTGGAYLHINDAFEMKNPSRARQALELFGSTSPSYLILQSLDLCNAYLSEQYREHLFQTVQQVRELKEYLSSQGWDIKNSEPLKITLCSPSPAYPGSALADFLRQNGAECEYADRDYLVMMFSPMNNETDYERIRQIFSRVYDSKGHTDTDNKVFLHPPVRAMSIRQALFADCEEIPVSQAVGRICGTHALSCPPAVPVIVSGEIIDKDAVEILSHYGIKSVFVVK